MTGQAAIGRFLGKYRATVVDNVDPEQRGRLQLSIPDVFGPIPSTWAEACVPLAGPTGPAMGVYFVPPIGAGVWAEFEQGDLNYPIWVGCRWGSKDDVPTDATSGNPADPNIIIQSLQKQFIMISDMPPSPEAGGIIVKSASGAMIVVNDSGIYITNGRGAKITLVSSTVSINDDALSVT